MIRAKLLAGLVATSLRRIDFFCSKTATKQRETHFPGEFPPWKHMVHQNFMRSVHVIIASGYLIVRRLTSP